MMSVFICDVITYCVWNFYMGKINVYDKIMIENQKKKNIWKSKKFDINLDLKDRLQVKFIHC